MNDEPQDVGKQGWSMQCVIIFCMFLRTQSARYTPDQGEVI